MYSCALLGYLETYRFSTTKTFRVRKGMSIQLSCRLEKILQSLDKSNSSSLLSVVQNAVQTTLETCYVALIIQTAIFKLFVVMAAIA